MTKFKSVFFEGNRINLAKKCPNALIVISAHNTLQSSSDTTFPFRQDSNFWYLTGLNLPDLILIIDTNLGESVILLPTLNDYQKEWDGETNLSKITDISGIRKFKSSDILEKMLQKAKTRKQNICFIAPPDEFIQPYGFFANPSRRKISDRIKKIDADPKDIRMDIARLRQIKQPPEIDALQEAIDITAKSLESVKSRLSEFKNEADLSRALSAEFYKNGSDGHGFEPIIASGVNASIIHYTNNDSEINSKDLILLDVGACSGYYSADISRTWSIAKPSKRQIEVHKAVVEIQDFAFSLLKPGVSLKTYQKTVEQRAKTVMKKINCSNAEAPYPHGISHFLGLDVHDAGDYDQPLQENMIITVEPGIYLKDEAIGIRIEDDVLITSSGIKNLSSKISRNL